MADPFGRGSSSGGGGSGGRSDPFGRGGSGGKPKKKTGGVLGVIERTGSDLYHAAVNTPAGVVALGKGLATHPIGTVEAVAKSTAQDLRHPLRHPGYTLLDLWGLASAGAGTAGRIGAIGKALETGSTAGDVARAALHGPHPGVRTLGHDGVNVEVPASKSPLTRLLQRQADTQIAKRAPGVNARRVGKQLRKQERIVGGLERGPASALIAAGRKLSPEQQTALRVVAEGVPISDRLATHTADLASATGRTARRLQRKIDLLHGATKFVDETAGAPKIAAEHMKLQTIYGKLEQVAHGREDLLKRVGELTPHAIEERLHGPGRIFKGAKYERTPARTARAEQTREYQGRSKTVTRALTTEEAHARLGELDKQYQTLVTRLVPEVSPYGGAIGKREQLRRNFENSRAGKGKRIGMRVQPTVKAEEFRLAEDKLLETIAKHRGNATADRVAALVDERQKLRDALNAHGEAGISGETPPPLPSVTETIPGKPRRVHLREVKAQRATAGLVGAEDFRGGNAYIPHGPDQRGVRANLTRPPQVGSSGVIGKPAPLKTTRKPLTGGAIHAGTFGDRTTELVGRSNLEAHKLGALLRLRDAIRPAVHATPQSPHDIMVRLDELGRNEPLPGIAKELRDKLDLGARLTQDEQRAVQGAFDAVRSRIFPSTGGAPLAPEAEAELAKLFQDGKIGFVDRRLLGGLDKPQPRLENFIGNRGAKVFDATNNASRAAILYLKPAYAVPNLLGNATLNVLQQGFAAPIELGRSLRLARNPELAARVDEVMGEGFSRILAGDSGIGTRAIQAAANFWGGKVDTPFRRASFLYEARRAGYTSADELRALLTDEAHRSDLVEVARRANAEIIDYANLSPIERAVIARIVFFYPWVKGSSAYAAHFVADHPVEAMIAAQIGRMGKETTDKQLGPLPSYLEGLIPVGKAKDGNPLVVNPSSAAIFQTPAQVGRGIAGLATGDKASVAELSNFTTPAVSALVELISGHALGSSAPIHGAQNVAYDSLIRSLPQTTLIQNLLQAAHGKGKGRLYPPSIQSALLQYLAGGIVNPRELNVANARKQAAQGR